MTDNQLNIIKECIISQNRILEEHQLKIEKLTEIVKAQQSAIETITAIFEQMKAAAADDRK